MKKVSSDHVHGRSVAKSYDENYITSSANHMATKSFFASFPNDGAKTFFITFSPYHMVDKISSVPCLAKTLFITSFHDYVVSKKHFSLPFFLNHVVASYCIGFQSLICPVIPSLPELYKGFNSPPQDINSED
jgi:hypothetical protein